MKTFFFYFVTLLTGLWLQIMLHYVLGGSWFSLQILLTAVVYWGLSRGPLVGQLIGFGWGLLLDASSLGFLGQNAWLGAIAGFAAGVSRRQLDETKPWTQVIFTFGISIFYIAVAVLMERFFSAAERPSRMSWLLQPVWNALAAPLLFPALRAWDQLWGIGRAEE